MIEEKKSHNLLKFLLILLLFLIIIFIYSYFIEPHFLKVNEVAIYNSKLSKDYNGLKIAHFSDLHYGRTTTEKDLKKIVNSLNELNPDIVIFTGDLFDNKNISDKDKKIVTKYLKNINSKLFKFAVIGDYDIKYLDTYKTILDDSNFTLLNNTNKLVYYDTKIPINFIGITNSDNIQELYDNKYFNITLTHKPDIVKKIKNSSLAFAGHSLGGQIKLPFIGGIRKKDGTNNYLEGKYKVNNTELYVSNGIGTQDLSFRFLNSPSITLYRIYNS